MTPAAGLSEDDQQLIVVAISENPMLGDVMPGTGGCRKIRFAGKGKGKRGGYWTVHYYAKAMAGYAEEYRAGVRKKVATLKR